MMKCLDIGTLQEYIDQEQPGLLDDAQIAAHLTSCADCRARLAELQELQAWSDKMLQHEEMEGVKYEMKKIDTNQAWEQFSERVQQEKSPSPVVVPRRKRTKWLAAAAAAAVVVGSLTIPQVQVAANNFLSIFRVDQVEMVKLTNDDIQELNNWLSGAEAGVKNINGIGQIEIKDVPAKEEREFDSVEKARQAGITVPAIPDGYTTTDGRIRVHAGFTINMKLDTEKVNKLIRDLGGKAEFDTKLNGKTFTVVIPQSVNMDIKKEGATGHKKIIYSAVGAPEIRVPEGVDMEHVRQTVLALPFIPKNVKEQLSRIEDWQHTLPVPYVENDQATMKETTLHGSKAFMFTGTSQQGIMWQKNGTFYTLNHFGGQEQDIDLRKLAEQMDR